MSMIDQAQKRVDAMRLAVTMRRDTGLCARDIARRTGLGVKLLRDLFRDEGIDDPICIFKVEWTPDMDAALREMRATGKGYIECADRIGVGVSTLKRRVLFLGLPKGVRGNPNLRKAA